MPFQIWKTACDLREKCFKQGWQEIRSVNTCVKQNTGKLVTDNVMHALLAVADAKDMALVILYIYVSRVSSHERNDR